ncbi:MAG: rhodanese-like domain-containing protein [Oscillospiraceae bacterium]|nr:rhodanese-like domain-containing protein [Oscillospiraceae bacterium]
MAIWQRFITGDIRSSKHIGVALVLIVVLLVAFLIFAPARGDANETATVITASEARELMEDGQRFVLLDVRSEEEFILQHIPGARVIPYTEVAERMSVEFPDRETRILVYCRTGGRSAAAAQSLTRLGYTNVYDLGGINGWPYETASG